jgi:hypothetical protein
LASPLGPKKIKPPIAAEDTLKEERNSSKFERWKGLTEKESDNW